MLEIMMFIVCVWFFFAVIIPAIGSFFGGCGSVIDSIFREKYYVTEEEKEKMMKEYMNDHDRVDHEHTCYGDYLD